jgi:cytochrome c oxidase subunit 1
MPRRISVWSAKRGGEGLFDWAFWNFVSSIGAFLLAFGVLLFIINVIKTSRKPRHAPLDPWDARSLEWLTTCPPKEHNFDALPTVSTLDEFFHRKYAEDPQTGELIQIATAEELLAEQEAHAEAHIHLPSPSYWPLIVALGLPVMGYGVIFERVLIIVGGAIVLLGLFGWALEPSVADEGDFGPPTGEGNGPAAGDGGPSKELSTVG